MTKNTTTSYNQTFFKRDCHKGNTAIYTEPNGGTLYIGGWTNEATFDWNTHVIDLTGTEHKYWDIPFAYDEVSKEFMPFLAKSYAGWLSLPFPDYNVPAHLNTREQWDGITEVIRNILRKGTDVLVACAGGHGRSGLFCSIVGYLLNIDHDKTWSSPVEKIRSIHCSEAVETINQEKFVYNILGLRIQITHAYIQDDLYIKSGSGNFVKCPICGTSSMYVEKYGSCLNCNTKFLGMKNIPTKDNLTAKDLDTGSIEHVCTDEKCVGIWKARKCGHIVHNMLIIDGFCEVCFEANEEAEKIIAAVKKNDLPVVDGFIEDDPCAFCGKITMYSKKFGVCYECQEEAITQGLVDSIHNSLTDPYHAVSHDCNDVSCYGIVQADVCKHVIHNRDVEDGKCPSCIVHDNKRRQEVK